jgi:hypothetical protein
VCLHVCGRHCAVVVVCHEERLCAWGEDMLGWVYIRCFGGVGFTWGDREMCRSGVARRCDWVRGHATGHSTFARPSTSRAESGRFSELIYISAFRHCR